MPCSKRLERCHPTCNMDTAACSRVHEVADGCMRCVSKPSRVLGVHSQQLEAAGAHDPRRMHCRFFKQQMQSILSCSCRCTR